VIDYKRPCKEVFCFPESGVYDTDDEKLIAWMKKNKPHISGEEIVEPIEEELVDQETYVLGETADLIEDEKPQESNDDLSELREKAKELGIKRAHLMKKETLLNKISEFEPTK
jgi:hypothetical protein